MGLFGMFGGNKVDALEGEMGPGMVNMLAGMPGMMRKQMMKGRINQLLTLGEEKRQESIVGMFRSFHNQKVKNSNRDKVIATRLEIVGELADDKRLALITSRIAALKGHPDLAQKDQEVQERILPKVDGKARAAFMRSWTELHKGQQN